MIRLAALALAFCLAALPLRANPYAGMIEMRLIPGWQTREGTLIAGLELSLAPGWKTYWRAPGDAGVPPVFDWSASRNLEGVVVEWPRPVVFDQNGMRSIGYRDRVILPLAIAPGRADRPVQLSGQIDIGICKDICVPIRLGLDGTLDPAASRPVPAIAAALADRPLPGSEAGLGALECSVTPTPDGLILTARFLLPPTGHTETAVLETGDPLVWASEPKVTRKGPRLTAEFELMNATGGAFALDRSALRFTILGEMRAVDIRGCSG